MLAARLLSPLVLQERPYALVQPPPKFFRLRFPCVLAASLHRTLDFEYRDGLPITETQLLRESMKFCRNLDARWFEIIGGRLSSEQIIERGTQNIGYAEKFFSAHV